MYGLTHKTQNINTINMLRGKINTFLSIKYAKIENVTSEEKDFSIVGYNPSLYEFDKVIINLITPYRYQFISFNDKLERCIIVFTLYTFVENQQYYPS